MIVKNLRYTALALAAVAFCSCQKEPSTSDLHRDYLVYTAHDTGTDFAAIDTYYIPDSILISGNSDKTEYWKDAGVQPDIISMAKSIAAGVPLAAITAREEIAESVPGGVIGGTFGGNALACAAALKTIEIMERDNLAKRSADIGAKVVARYKSWADKFDVVGDIRGLGGMVGIEFIKDQASKAPATDLVNTLIKDMAAHGLLVENAGTYGNVIRFLAPLVITDEQLEAGLDIFEAALTRAVAK